MLDFSFSNILHSNVINFAIMIAIFAVIIKKLNVSQKIEDMRASVQKKVEESDSLKETAKKDFEKVTDSLKNIDEELNEIIKKAENAAKAFEQKSKEELTKTVETIKANIEKQVEAEHNHIKADLLQNVSSSSIETAQRQIKNTFNKDKQLHRKYIEEFINSIDKLDV